MIGVNINAKFTRFEGSWAKWLKMMIKCDLGRQMMHGDDAYVCAEESEDGGTVL